MSRRADNIVRAFSSGEQSPNMEARADLARWKSALKQCVNFVPMVQGGATRRSGTADVNARLANSRLIPFAFSDSDGYAIEVAPGKCRFYRDYGVLLNGSATPYELSNNFTAAEVAALCPAGSANVVYLAANGTKPITKLKRNDTLDWQLSSVAFKNGPFMDDNADDTIFLYTDDTNDLDKDYSFHLKVFPAASGFFSAAHVGALFLIREMDGRAISRWGPDDDSAGTYCRWGDNVYKNIGSTGNGNTGPNPPIHTTGAEWDGLTHSHARLWLYQHSGYGIVQVTSYVSASEVVVKAITALPFDLHGQVTGGALVKLGANDLNEGGTRKWAEGAWSDVRGYPRIIAIHKKRLYAGSTPAQPTAVWASREDDFENMEPGTLDTDAIGVVLESGNGRVNEPQWMISGKKLAIGTSGDEFIVGSADVTAGITPSSIDPEATTTEGSWNTQAEKIDGPVFISKDRRRVHEIGYDFQHDSYAAPDLTIEADHITDSGLLRLAWQRDPYRILWATRSDGTLVAMTYRKDQDIIAWHRHPTIKGKVKDICVVPAPSGDRQDLWLIVERSFAGGTVDRIECLKPFFERGDLAITESWFVDNGVRYHNDVAVTTISGLPAHWEGETIDIMADGQVRARCVVTSGSITLDRPANTIIMGFAFESLMESLRYDHDVQGGALSGRKSRIVSPVVDVLRAAGLEVACGDGAFQLLQPSGGGVMNAPNDMQTGILPANPIPNDWAHESRLTLRTNTPLPATVRAWNVIAEGSE